MVAVLRAAGRVDEAVVAHQLRGPLVGVAGQEAVVALEAETERPAGEGPRRALLPPRGEVPLPDGEGAVPGVPQNPRQGGRRSGDAPVVARKSGWDVGQEAHPHGVVVASGEERGPGGRAQRRDVEPVVAQPLRGEPIDGRGRQIRPEAAELREAEVVEDHHDDVRRATGRPGHRRERGHRIGDRAPDRRGGGHRRQLPDPGSASRIEPHATTGLPGPSTSQTTGASPRFVAISRVAGDRLSV